MNVSHLHLSYVFKIFHEDTNRLLIFALTSNVLHLAAVLCTKITVFNSHKQMSQADLNNDLDATRNTPT